MTTDADRDLIASLEDVLDKERQALCDGDIQAVQRLLALKEELVNQVHKLDLSDGAELQAVRASAQRNCVLLASAGTGIRAVLDRISELKQIRKGAQTYDCHGRKARLQTSSKPALEKRA